VQPGGSCWGSHHSDEGGVAQGNSSRRCAGSGPPATPGARPRLRRRAGSPNRYQHQHCGHNIAPIGKHCMSATSPATRYDRNRLESAALGPDPASRHRLRLRPVLSSKHRTAASMSPGTPEERCVAERCTGCVQVGASRTAPVQKQCRKTGRRGFGHPKRPAKAPLALALLV
jgi:hypothetical protein